MALQSFTITIGALTDASNNGKNYVDNQPVYIKKTNGTLASIYRDLAGTSQIAQDGLSNVTNSKGQFTFFVEAGDYYAEYQSQVTPITVVGPDYFNNRIDETVNQIILDLSTSRGFRVRGTFAAGFTYELPNDVGLDASGNAWIYTDVSALPFAVPSATSPSFPTYTQVTFNQSSNVSNNDGSTVQDVVDRLDVLTVQDLENSSFSTGCVVNVRYVDAAKRVSGARFEIISSSEASSRGLSLGYSIDDGVFNGEAFTISNGNVAAVLNDLFGFQQALLAEASLNPSELPDRVGSSKYLDAIKLVANQSAVESDLKLKARIQRAGQFQIAGSVCILGDSITVGEGATSLSSSYASLVQRSVADFQTGGYGPDNEVNFNWSTMGGVALSGQSQGTAGPIQRSQIISVGGTITITRPNATKIAFFYEQTTTSGNVEIRQNGALLSTVDCSGSDVSSVLSPYVNIAPGGANVQFLVTGSPVEFVAIVPIADNENQPNVTMSMRMAVSGWNTSHFLSSPSQLISASECAGIGGADSVFVLALGTNDIYTAARPPIDYKANLKSIGETLQSFRPSNVIVLTVPPIPDESLFPPAISQYTHADYRREIYNLSREKNWSLVDYSFLNLAERNLYADGIHPNDRGHQEMAITLLDRMGLMLEPPISGSEREAIESKSDAKMFRRSADLTTFTGTTTREKTLTSMGVTSFDFINGIYLRWKTSGVMIPIEHCQDFAGGGQGIQVLRSFTGADYSVAKMFYSSPANDGSGFAAAIGPLSGSISADHTDVEVIVEFTRSLNIDSDL